MTGPRLLLRIAAMLFFSYPFNDLSAQELRWANATGSAATEKGYTITTDDTGNVYTFGTYLGTADLDPGVGTFNLPSYSGKSFFIQKLDSAGNFKWAVGFGSSSLDNMPGSIKLDKEHNIIVTGKLVGVMDADSGPGVVNIAGSGVGSSFTIKLNSAAEYIWARAMPGNTGNDGTASAVDDSCNVYIVGDFFGTVDLDPGPGNFTISATNTWDVFFLKLDSAGNFMWAERIGAAMIDRCNDIEIDSAGNFYACGRYGDMIDADPGPGVHNLTGGNINMFVIKCDRNGNFLAAAGTSGLFGDVFVRDLSLDKQRNIHLIGRFHGTVDFNTGASVLNFNAGTTYDAFTVKLDSSCNFLWAKHLKSTGPNVYGYDIDVDTAGNVYTVGSFSDSLGIVLSDTSTHFLVAGETEINGFIIKRNSAGDMLWAHQLSGTDSNALIGVHVDRFNSIYTTGYFSGTVDFDFLTTTEDLTSGGAGDLFVQKLKTDTTVTVSVPELSSDRPFNIYPNPSAGITYIVAEQDINKLTVTDMLGRKVYEVSPQKRTLSISLSTPGIYFVTIRSGDKVSTQKINVQ